MRFAAIALLTFAAVLPAAAQQPSFTPLTGTSSAQPAPGASTAPEAAPSGPAARAGRRRMSMQERFDTANTTHDGKLTAEQARAGNMPRIADNFDAIDAKKNGYVTMEDIRAWSRTQRAARRAKAPQ